MKKPVPPNLKRLSAAKQRRLDDLLDKNAEGAIAPGEKTELERLVAEAERLMVANVKRLAAFTADENTHAPSAAVPVTVWVKPEHAQARKRCQEPFLNDAQKVPDTNGTVALR